MSSNKSGSPVRSPKPPKLVKLEVPKTPPSAKPKNRLLVLLATPEQPQDLLPFSPTLKRTNLGSLKSPDYKLNSHDGHSPYLVHNLLKTPRNSGYDSDDKDTPHRNKLMRTPQFFSPGRRLFAEDQSPNKQELLEISSQLKSKLSLALGKIKGTERLSVAPVKLDFTELSFTSAIESSPKKLQGHPSSSLPPSSSLLRTNINLQTLQQLPSVPRRHLKSQNSGEDLLNQSHAMANDRISMPSPDEESSAQNALLAAFSRLRNRRHSGNSERRSSVVLLVRETQSASTTHSGHPHIKLPPLNVALTNNQGDDGEQEAIYSLMSLSSPHSVKKPNEAESGIRSRLHSQNDTSPVSSRSTSVVVQLPPISGIIKKVDNDETDLEDETTDEEMST